MKKEEIEIIALSKCCNRNAPLARNLVYSLNKLGYKAVFGGSFRIRNLKHWALKEYKGKLEKVERLEKNTTLIRVKIKENYYYFENKINEKDIICLIN